MENASSCVGDGDDVASAVWWWKRERTLHQILGGGIAADVILWRRGNVTVGMLVAGLSCWVMFEKSGYTLLSLVSNVLLLLIVIFFIWAKSAAILNRPPPAESRPPPPLPKLQLSEDLVNEVAAYVRCHVNSLLSISYEIALAKHPRLFFKLAFYLWLISIISSWTDLLTWAYTAFFLVLTVPALFERYETHVDKYMLIAYTGLRNLYGRFDKKHLTTIREFVLEKTKLD